MLVENRVDKQKRYRQKCVSEGRCPHCGKACAPYYECDERRAYRRIQRILLSLVKVGNLSRRRLSNGTNLYQYRHNTRDSPARVMGYKIKADDIRHRPKVHNRFVNYSKIIDEIFKNDNRKLSEDEIIEIITANIMMQKGYDCNGRRSIL